MRPLELAGSVLSQEKRRRNTALRLAFLKLLVTAYSLLVLSADVKVI